METRYGRFYRTRDGRKVGPIKKSPYGVGWLTADGFEGDQWYSSLHKKEGVEGKCYYGKEDPLDLVEEWDDKPANRFYGEQRVEIKPGEYGEISFYGFSRGLSGAMFAEVSVPDLLTADELREAAHLFVQLAEALERE